jgi:hypothetical protein
MSTVFAKILSSRKVKLTLNVVVECAVFIPRKTKQLITAFK